MRSAIDASTPLPDQSFGMPRMPTRKTSRIPTITANFQLRFLFIENSCTTVRLRAFSSEQPLERLAGPRSSQLHDYFPSSAAVVTDTTDARLISSFRLSGGTRNVR